MNEGWIKLFRKFSDWEWYTDIPTKCLFIHLLLLANHQPRKWRGKIINAGELITSIGSLANETALSEQQIRTALKKLESTGEIERKSTNKNTVIIVLNYKLYQGMEYDEQQADNNQITNEQQTNNKQVTTNKNIRIKELNKLKKEINKERKNESLENAFSDFKEMRKKIKKPLTDKAEQMIWNKLQGYSEAEQIEMLNTSTMNCWLSVYPLKEKEKKPTSYDLELAKKMAKKKVVYDG